MTDGAGLGLFHVDAAEGLTGCVGVKCLKKDMKRAKENAVCGRKCCNFAGV